jgi:hypothetical protein
MNAAARPVRARDSQLQLLIVLALLAAALLWFVTSKAHYLTDYSLASYTDYMWPRRAGRSMIRDSVAASTALRLYSKGKYCPLCQRGAKSR